MKNAPAVLMLTGLMAACGASSKTNVNSAQLPALDIDKLGAHDLVCCWESNGLKNAEPCVPGKEQQEECARLAYNRFVHNNSDVKQCRDAAKLRAKPDSVLTINETRDCIAGIELKTHGAVSYGIKENCKNVSGMADGEVICLRRKVKAAHLRCTQAEVCDLVR